MRFQSTSRPVLTPFGERLLVLSERKLNNLEAPLGGRDEPTLLKGVLVREAVKSAWRSVETGQQAEVNDWQSETAMGLDVIGEEDEEEEDGASEAHNHTHESVVEQRNERWFEELVESFGEDDGIETHEWIESEVGAPVDYDDFAYEEFEHYTLPSPPPPSPLQVPASPSSPSSTLSSILSPASSTVELDVEPETESSAIVDIDVVEVPDYDDDELYGDEIVSAPLRKDSIPSTPLLSAASSPSSSPIPVISLSDDELDCDDLYLPPPLHRCSSSSSLCTSDEDGDCVTPSSSCEDLELSVGSLSLEDDIVLADPGDSTRLAFDYASFARKVERWQTWDGPPLPLHAGVLGLDLDISIGMADTI